VYVKVDAEFARIVNLSADTFFKELDKLLENLIGFFTSKSTTNRSLEKELQNFQKQVFPVELCVSLHFNTKNTHEAKFSHTQWHHQDLVQEGGLKVRLGQFTVYVVIYIFHALLMLVHIWLCIVSGLSV